MKGGQNLCLSLFTLATFFLAAGVAAPNAHCAGMDGAVRADYHNPKDAWGLCTDENKGQQFMEVGLCLSLWEQLHSGCTQKLVEKIRQHILADNDPNQPGDKPAFELGFSCQNGGAPDTKPQLPEIAKNPEQFTFLLMQFFAAIAVQESDWNVLDKVPQGNEPLPAGENMGVLDLNLQDMTKPDYSCGCTDKVITCPNGSGSEGSGGTDTVPGPCPGPSDGHHSMICGEYMALYWADKDGQLFGGKYGKMNDPRNRAKSDKPSKAAEPDASDDGPKGATRIWPDLGDNPKSVVLKSNTEFVQGKMDAFCKKGVAGQTNIWDRQPLDPIGTDGQKLAPSNN